MTSHNPLVWLSLLVIRGVLLWLIVPMSFVVWVVAALWLVPRGATLGKFLGWIDSNFIFLIERTLLRPFFSEPTHLWIHFSDVSRVSHRVGGLDFV